MRKEIPVLTDDLIKEKFLDIIVASFQTMIFATIDDNNHGHSNAADIELRDGEKLVFSTIVNGAF